MFDINAIVCSITGHCSLCHKKSNVSILNNGVCMACTLDLAEKCNDKGADELKVVEKDGVWHLISQEDCDYQEQHEGSEDETND